MREDSFGRDGAYLHYRHYRPEGESRAALISLHGFGEHGGMVNYRMLAEAMGQAGIETWQLDLRGNGRSDGRRGFVDRWADFREDVRAFAELIPKGRPRFVCGLSMGGLVALDYALHYPKGLAGAIAVSPPVGDVGLAPWLLALGRAVSWLWPGLAMHTRIQPERVSRDTALVEEYMRDPEFSLRGTARLLTELFKARDMVRGSAKCWQVPLLLMQGSADAICPPDANFFAQARRGLIARTVYEGARHNLFLETNRDEVFRDIGAWIAGRLGSR